MTQLATRTDTPRIHVSRLINVSRVVLANAHIAHLFEERLDAGGMIENDSIKTWNAQLSIAIISKGIDLLLVIHDDSVVRATKHLHNLDTQIELAWHRAISEIARAELSLLVAAPSIQFTVLSDARRMLETTRHLANLLAFDLNEAKLSAVSNGAH